MPEFSRRNIILHRFRVNKNEGESGIGYNMIIGHGIVVQLGLLSDFKRKVLQWDEITVPMK